MASLYDMIEVQGSPRYRMNKVFIGESKVPEEVKKVLTLENIVDENGLIVVDTKNEEAKAAPEDETTDGKLPRVDNEPHAADAPDPTTDAAADEAGETPATDTKEGDPEPDLDEDEGEDGPKDADNDEPTNDPDPADEQGEDEPEKTTAAPKAETAADEDKEEKPKAKKAKAAPAQKAAGRPPKFISKVPQSQPGMGFPRVNGKTVDIFDGKTPHTHVKLIGGYAVPLSAENYNSQPETAIIARLKELGFEPIDYASIEAEQANAGQPANGPDIVDEEVDEDIKLG